MDIADHYWLWVGLALGAGFVIGAVFGAWVMQNAYRGLGRAVEEICRQVEEDELD